MKCGVIVFPGSNCDHDCYAVLHTVCKTPVEYIWHKDTDIDRFDCIVIPGGFSYGDYLRTGAIARFSPVMQAVVAHAKKGKTVIGICNGFQILLEAGLLPGAMLRNTSLHFICRYVTLRVAHNNTPFTRSCHVGEILHIPIAHNEGNYYTDQETLKQLQDNEQIIFQYCDEKGQLTEAANPNGSLANIAGICNKERNVLGMMPHPERACEDVLGSHDGLRIFDSLLRD